MIAVFGFPDKTGFIEYKEKGKPFYYELSGYIARSHGFDLRNIIEYLKKYMVTYGKHHMDVLQFI